MTVGGILAAVLKLLVGRDRPELLDPVAQAAGYSFPSGHADNAALACRRVPAGPAAVRPGAPGCGSALWTAAIVIPLVTGLCRIGLGVHWTSDVLAGWLLGIATVGGDDGGLRELAATAGPTGHIGHRGGSRAGNRGERVDDHRFG